MRPLRIISDMYDCVAALISDGWIVAGQLLPDLDAEYLKELGRFSIDLRDDHDESDWQNALAEQPRRVMMAGWWNGNRTETTLTEAERVCGPALDANEDFAVAWTERRAGRWRLAVHTQEGTRTVREHPSMLRAPAVAWAGNDPCFAFVSDERGAPTVQVCDRHGEVLFSHVGDNPVLRGTPDGSLFLALEVTEGATRTRLVLFRFDENDQTMFELPPADDLNLHPHMAYDAVSRVLHVVWESSPSWGWDERVRLHRNLALWTLRSGGAKLEPAPGTAAGLLPLPRRAFLDGSMHNFTPTRPRTFALDGTPAVTFRQFRFTGVKCYGWDTFITQLNDGRWTAPRRVSPNPGQPDAAYALLARDKELLGFFPCCDQRPIRTFAEEASGAAGTGRTGFAFNHRAEVLQFSADEALPPVPVPPGREALYVIPPSMPATAPPPARPGGVPEALHLVWGDLHAHSAYSKCMGANDGTPMDVLRLQRDLLQNEILCLTEHVEYMTSPEFVHVLDEVERMAGDRCLPLYGVEWAKLPAHHTNIFSFDREVYDRLRALMLACDHLTPLYARIKDELPPGSVLAIRHMHGMGRDEFGVNGSRVTETHDPEMEWAMEAMQTRGNMMLAERGSWPLFPTNFLNSGARLGLVGGSDHSRGDGPNRFCITGFWVKELTPRGVLEALRDRRTIACANGKMALYAELGGEMLGRELNAASPVTVTVRMASATPIRRVALMRDGELLEWQHVDSQSAEMKLVDEMPGSGYHWYVVTAEADSPVGRPPLVAQASPFFVEVN